MGKKCIRTIRGPEAACAPPCSSRTPPCTTRSPPSGATACMHASGRSRRGWVLVATCPCTQHIPKPDFLCGFSQCVWHLPHELRPLIAEHSTTLFPHHISWSHPDHVPTCHIPSSSRRAPPSWHARTPRLLSTRVLSSRPRSLCVLGLQATPVCKPDAT